ncbi:MAG: hypothetical protein RIM99_04540 [Cyclobacteriaceae bacterium]
MCLFVPFLIDAQSETHSDELTNELVRVEFDIFSFEDEVVISQLILKKSKIQSGAKDYPAALKTLQRVNVYNLSDSLKHVFFKEQIVLHYLLGNHGQAKSMLLEAGLLDSWEPDDDLRLTEILNDVALGNFNQAKELYHKLNPGVNVLEVFDVKKVRNPQKAFNLSLLLPGSGQIYAGSFLKGISSAGIQTLLFAYGIRGIQKQYYFTEALTSIALFQGFYFGGAEYARELADERNNNISRELSVKILDSFK